MKKFVFILVVFSNLMAGSFLFDYTKDETAGNADWVIDNDYPDPYPPDPQNPDEWIGAISSWAFALHQLGHVVKTLPPGHSITYGDPSNPLDLSNFDVFILCEPQDPISPAERQAIINFVQNGGGLMLVANHYGSDRNNNGFDAPRIFDKAGFDTIFGIHFNLSGEPHNNLWDAPDSNVSQNPDDPIIHGPAGNVGAIGYYAGTAMTLWPQFNSFVEGHIWVSGEPHNNQNVTLATSRYGNGRIVGIGDSSPADDGTGNPGNNLFNGWTQEGEDNDIAFINASLWLLGESSRNMPPYITDVTRIPLFPADTDTVLIKAKIFDDSHVEEAKLFISVQNGNWFYHETDSISGDYYFFHINPYPENTRVAYYLYAIDDSGASTVTDTSVYTVYSSQGINIGGFTIIQQSSSRSFTFPDITVPPNGLVLISRNSTLENFESFWHVDLPENVIFLNSGGHFPVINGHETYTLISPSGDTIDGPTPEMLTGKTFRRINPQDPWSVQSWMILEDSLANPGYFDLPQDANGLFISEIADASGSGNYIYEFVELAFVKGTSVNENRGNSLILKLFPNPSYGVVNLQTKDTLFHRFTVFNVSGEKVMELTLGGSNFYRIRLKNLKAGLYFVSLDSKGFRRLLLLK